MKIDPKMLLGGAVPVAYNMYKQYRADKAATAQANDEEEKRRRELMAGKAPTPGMKKGGKVGSASKRADGCAMRGKTKGKII